MSRSLGIDTYSVVFRSFYAVHASPQPTRDALAVMSKMIEKAAQSTNPHYVFAAADCPEPTFRHKLDPNYKASRKPAPPELKELIPLALQQLEQIGIPVLRCPGYEADDVLATLAKQLKEGHQLDVLSSDRDLVGMVRPGVDLLLMQNGGVQKRIDCANASSLFGVDPSLVADYKALAGDASDNISGVVGIGPKTTLALLNEHGSLQAILEKRASLSGKAALLIKDEAAETALLCQQLAQLNDQAPVDFAVADSLWSDEKLARLRSA